MNTKTLYDVLQVSKSASDEVITAAYLRLKDIYSTKYNGGDQDAKNELIFLQDAYNVLRSPEKRRNYDYSLTGQGSRGVVMASPGYYDSHQRESVFLEWWNGSLMSKLFWGVAIFLIGFGVYKFLGQNKDKANDGNRINNEKILIEGVVKNQSDSIDGNLRIQEKRTDLAYGVAEREAETRRLEAESRAQTREQLLALQRQRQEEQIKQAEWRREQYEKQQATRESKKPLSRDKQALCQIYMADRRYAEAREAGCYSR